MNKLQEFVNKRCEGLNLQNLFRELIYYDFEIEQQVMSCNKLIFKIKTRNGIVIFDWKILEECNYTGDACGKVLDFTGQCEDEQKIFAKLIGYRE